VKVALALVVGLVIGACVARKGAVAPNGRSEITALWTQIRDWRREAGMDVEPPSAAVNQAERMDVGTARRAPICRAYTPTPACDDVCGLADAICDNATNICDLAAGMPGDVWAEDKCNSAKASCREAKERCCSCDDPETAFR
jgi:hypothetical protein